MPRVHVHEQGHVMLRHVARPSSHARTARAPALAYACARWVLLVDDDTFVFYHNLKTHLELMDHSKKIYTGLVSPSYWIPTNLSLTEPHTPRTDPSAFRAQCTTCTKCTVHR